MKITFGGQPLLYNNLSGVGVYTKNIIQHILEIDRENDYALRAFDFLGKKGLQEIGREHLKDINGLGADIKICKLLPATVYIRYQGVFAHVPYEVFFGGKSDISHFFNYFIPYNIKGKKIVTVHDMVYKRFPETMSKRNLMVHKKNLEIACKSADVVVTVSENSKNEISEFIGVPEDRIIVTYNGIDLNRFKKTEDRHNRLEVLGIHKPYVLFVGTLEPRKNIKSIINAFKAFEEKHPEHQLVLAGGKGWMYDEIFEQVQSLKLGNKVVFTDYVSQADLPVLYSQADLFVFPSLYEGFGIPPLEAMACGTPVIAANNSSLPEVIGNAGLLVDANDHMALASDMDKLVSDEVLAGSLIDRGYEQVKKFNWHDSAAKLVNLYGEI